MSSSVQHRPRSGVTWGSCDHLTRSDALGRGPGKISFARRSWACQWCGQGTAALRGPGRDCRCRRHGDDGAPVRLIRLGAGDGELEVGLMDGGSCDEASTWQRLERGIRFRGVRRRSRWSQQPRQPSDRWCSAGHVGVDAAAAVVVERRLGYKQAARTVGRDAGWHG